jgi:hypothetical protein
MPQCIAVKYRRRSGRYAWVLRHVMKFMTLVEAYLRKNIFATMGGGGGASSFLRPDFCRNFYKQKVTHAQK